MGQKAVMKWTWESERPGLVALPDRCLARAELVGHADVAFRALGVRPLPYVTDLPRRKNDPRKEYRGTRDSYASKSNSDKASHKWGIRH